MGTFDIKKIDWNYLKRLMTVQSVKDLDSFLDRMPLNVGPNVLIAISIVWLAAFISIFFTIAEVNRVSTLRAELMKVESLKPPVPIITYQPVSANGIKEIQNKIQKTFQGLSFTGPASSLKLTASDTDYFPQFLAAIHFLQYGGRNWRVTVNTLCVGQDCTGAKLAAELRVESVRIDDPIQIKTAD